MLIDPMRTKPRSPIMLGQIKPMTDQPNNKPKKIPSTFIPNGVIGAGAGKYPNPNMITMQVAASR